jgi:hypothetical protein
MRAFACIILNPMCRLNKLTALCVGVLLLAAPAAWACGEVGATAMSPCPMGEMPHRSGSMGTVTCHDDGPMSEGCCDVRSAPEPMQALTLGSTELLPALEVRDHQQGAPLGLAALPQQCPPADALRLHDLGRYTLFSSFLL